MMEITSIRIKKNHKQNGGVIGIASIGVDNCLIIHNIKLLQNNGQRMVAFPSSKIKKFSYKDGKYEERFEYSDLVHPSNTDFRKYIEDELFKVYDMEVSNEQRN